MFLMTWNCRGPLGILLPPAATGSHNALHNKSFRVDTASQKGIPMPFALWKEFCLMDSGGEAWR